MDINEFKNTYEHKKVIENDNQVPSNPLVSVCVQTYQHVNYIKECLDGILNQQTDFDFEILLGEDASTDGTREICLEYAKKYPDKIRLFLHHRENNIKIGGQPTGRFNFLYNLYSAQGKYIALCEGDDYWTDPLKLQKQVKILEYKSEISLVFSNRIIHDNESKFKKKHLLPYKSNIFSLNDVIGGFTPSTQTMLFRKDDNLSDFLLKYIKHPSGDQLIGLFYAMKGDLYLLRDITAAYRITGQGTWSSRRSNREYSLKLFLNSFKQILINEKIYNKFYFNSGVGRKLMDSKKISDVTKLKIERTNFFKFYCITIFKSKRIIEVIFQR